MAKVKNANTANTLQVSKNAKINLSAIISEAESKPQNAGSNSKKERLTNSEVIAYCMHLGYNPLETFMIGQKLFESKVILTPLNKGHINNSRRTYTDSEKQMLRCLYNVKRLNFHLDSKADVLKSAKKATNEAKKSAKVKPLAVAASVPADTTVSE